jgi:hypothetical protein
VCTLATKDNAKDAWDILKMLHVGDERVHEAKVQMHRRDFDRLSFKDGETMEEFALWMSTIVDDLDTLGDPVGEYKAVKKFLCVLPHKF